MQPNKRVNQTWPWPFQLFLLALVIMIMSWASGCASMHKPDETAQARAKDHYECEHEAYASTEGAPTLIAGGLYRDCMRARGYH